MNGPVIAIIGAGGVGAYYGGRLAQHGHDVHFLLRSDYTVVSRNGWQIKSIDGDFNLPPAQTRLYNDPSRMPPADLVIVTLKATANHLFEPTIRPLLKENTQILTLQNGLGNEDHLAALFGHERILGGLAFVCINRIAPGVIHHMDHGYVRIGDFQEGRLDRAQAIVDLFSRSRIKADALASLKYGRWEKLVWNVPFNGLGAVLDKTTDQLINNDPGLHLVRSLMAEIIAAAAAHGVNLPSDIIDTKIRQTATMGPYRSSMQVDRQTHRPMEVEAILGAPCAAAHAKGLSTPYLQTLYHMAQLLNLQQLA